MANNKRRANVTQQAHGQLAGLLLEVRLTQLELEIRLTVQNNSRNVIMSRNKDKTESAPALCEEYRDVFATTETFSVSVWKHFIIPDSVVSEADIITQTARAAKRSCNRFRLKQLDL